LIGTKSYRQRRRRAIRRNYCVLGFASAPGIFRLAGIIPLVDTFVWLSTSLWMLVTMIMATRQTLDYQKTVRAVIVCGLGFIVYVLVFMLFFLISDVV
jgi:hypothetical protein